MSPKQNHWLPHTNMFYPPSPPHFHKRHHYYAVAQTPNLNISVHPSLSLTPRTELISRRLYFYINCLLLHNKVPKNLAVKSERASLVAQWLGICLPMQGTRVRALAWEDPTCRGAAGPVSHNCWACASGACAPQQERLRRWEACALQWGVAPTCRSWRKPSHRDKDPTQP